MATATVRVTEETHDKLHELALAKDCSMQDVLTDAVMRFQSEVFWDQTDQTHERFKTNQGRRDKELAKRRVWEQMLTDIL
jgi:hypothetical protein